jgi:hypothetical protein
VARNIRLLEKKRGDRRTGSPLVGGLGEVLFFGVLFLLGSTSLTYLVTSQVLPVAQSPYQPGFGFWLMVLVTGSFTVIGGGGVVYTVLQVGTSAERRSAMVKKASQIELLGDATGAEDQYPTIPRDANLTNSPGIRLAYRLPVAQGGVWALLAATAFFLVWNGVATALATIAVKAHVSGQPDWLLSVFSLALVLVGIWAGYYFILQLLRHTGIGPTTVEISDHPLHPGRTYKLFVSQAGRLHVNKFAVALICDEETTYRQGTDIRTDHCRVFQQTVFVKDNFAIEPGKPFEQECPLTVPTNTMHSMQARHNAIRWMVVILSSTRSWPVFERRFPVVIHPYSNGQGTD